MWHFVGKNRWTSDLAPWVLDDVDEDNEDNQLFVHWAFSEKTDTFWF
jgi:hypothetical protein